jgi:hypothetical protein
MNRDFWRGDNMKKWNRFILGLAATLLVVAPVIPLNSSFFLWFGEPQLPKKLL